jgi:hypothetical protein
MERDIDFNGVEWLALAAPIFSCHDSRFTSAHDWLIESSCIYIPKLTR